MMTVLVIIGLMSSAVILTFPHEKPALEQQSDALLREINIMAQTSLISGTPSALGLSENSFAFMHFKDGQWQSPQETTFPGNIKATFSGEASEIKLSDELQPLVLFEPNGLSTPFTLTLSDGNMKTVFESTGNGRVVRSVKS